jgi:hypothetical protein
MPETAPKRRPVAVRQERCLQGLNAKDFAADDCKRRLVINHHDGRHRCAGVLIKELDQAVNVRKSDRESARGDFRNGIERALPRGNLDLNSPITEVAVVDCREIWCSGAFKFPVERKRHFSWAEARVAANMPALARMARVNMGSILFV